jgi:hypothetical protein
MPDIHAVFLKREKGDGFFSAHGSSMGTIIPVLPRPAGHTCFE